MRSLAHLSDLHFGRTDPQVVEALLADLAAQAPDLIIISGDLTQRARPGQFAAARAFIDRLPAPWLAVPGNHDIPVFNLINRFTRPLRHYRAYITGDLSPAYQDAELAVLGLNTARSLILDFSQGRLNQRQMAEIRRFFAPVPAERFKILFTHHPFLPPPDAPRTRLVGRAAGALESLEACGVDLLLAGHLHRGYTGDILSHHPQAARSILVAQASTATSTRLRNEPNAYNLIHIAPPRIEFQVRFWQGERFAAGLISRYHKAGERWLLDSDAIMPGVLAPPAA